MKDQSALGGKTVNRMPEFNATRLARVTSVKDYEQYGRIEVVFLDYSQPVPVWVFSGVDREPVEGDTVIVGYLDNRKDAPYLAGFHKNNSYGTNFVVVKRDMVKLQLPVFEIGVKDGAAYADIQGNLLDTAKQDQRAYVELSPNHVLLSYPLDKDGKLSPVKVELSHSAVNIVFPVIEGEEPASVSIGPDGIEHRFPIKEETAAYIQMSADGFRLHHPTGDMVVNLPKGSLTEEHKKE
ncbi:hypothetical protein [Paenibacillus massiliensis]|uniref:hypothetical protein n=1 Tax=Paenibacillus massiliensis TaxID=225917 RepID=UPI0003F646E7|nr:hypothetical protein [Paenibacillus massiliensis]